MESNYTGSSIIEAVDQKISSVRTQTIDLSFNELADMYGDGELVINPEFQRMFRWTEGAQARFIESLLLELPVPPIFMIEREDRVYELIDGLQRISSYLHFRGQLFIDGQLQDRLELSDCDIVPELNGRTYDQLPKALEIKLKRSYIRAEILRKESDPRLRYYMFKRLNTGGQQLTEQEIRNATIRLLSDDFNTFITEMSKNPDFLHCVDIISDLQKKTMFAQELVLRFFAYKNYMANYVHDIGDFLTDFMEDVSDPSTDLSFNYGHERHVFQKTFRVLRVISDRLGIDSKIFGTVNSKSMRPSGQFSVYHYEALTLGLQTVLDKIQLENEEHIIQLANVVETGKSDREFLNFTGAGKNFRNPLAARIQYFQRRFQEALDGSC